MKNTRIIIMAVFALSMLSCSKYNKLLKSTDTEKKYEAALKYYYKRDYKRASALFDNILPFAHGMVYEDTVLFYMGNSLYNLKEYDASAEMMDMYRNRFSRATFTEDAEYLYAMSYYKISAEPERDQANTNKAIIGFNEFLTRHPGSDKTEDIHKMIEELTQKLYLKTYLNAALYYKIGKYKAAIYALRSALKNNPEMPQKEQMMYLISRSWYDYAKGSVKGRQLDRYMRMIDSYYNFKSEFPDGSEFDNTLTDMFNEAQDYANMHGMQARELQKLELSIERRKAVIEQNRELIFDTDDPAEKDKLQKEIRQEQTAIKAERKLIKEQRKELEQTNKERPRKIENRTIEKESVSFKDLESSATKESEQAKQENAVKNTNIKKKKEPRKKPDPQQDDISNE